MNAVALSPICPLYTAPSAASPLADEVLCGWPLEVCEQPCPGWVRVRTDYRYEGYAPAAGLILGAGPCRRWAEREQRVVLQAAADVLDRPDVEGRRITTLFRGSLAAPLGGELAEGWQALCLPDGREGYTRSDFLGPYYKTPPSTDPEDLRKRVIERARTYLGVQYRWGGKSPLGIDCSGLVFMAWRLNGVSLHRDAKIVEGYPVREIPRNALAPADLLFFPGHVALYLGEGRYLHSTARSGSCGVVVNSLDPADGSFRPDLAERLTAVGSVFPLG